MSESECTHNCSTCASKKNGSCGQDATTKAISEQLAKIKHKIVVLSGKGGVGKSTCAVNLAISLAMEGHKVGLLDVDLHGPSVPTMLKLQGVVPETVGDKILPVHAAGISVISVAFFLHNSDDPVIWRGPMKQGAIQQFITDVEWGELDYLVIDCPPGTGDEPLGVCQMIPDAEAVIVTTPQEVAASDVRRSVNFCRQLNLSILGVIENMSGFACPHCGEITYIFKQGGGEKLAEQMNLDFLGKIPIDPGIGDCSDAGTPFVHFRGKTATAIAFQAIVAKIAGE